MNLINVNSMRSRNSTLCHSNRPFLSYCEPYYESKAKSDINEN